jgi:predicted GH43/DUF377 family glycosyl hydrolase
MRSCFGFLLLGIHFFVWIVFSLNPLAAIDLPFVLKDCPLAESQGIVLDVKRVEIRGLEFFYNASLIESGDTYRLFFRVDTPHIPPFVSHIGCVELDSNFNQTDKDYFFLDTKTDTSEDPRSLWVGNRLWLIYNDIASRSSAFRSMHAAVLDSSTFEVQKIIEMDLGLSRVEKNWTPFEGVFDSNEEPQLFFEYFIAPHILLHLDDSLENKITFYQGFSSDTYSLMWPKAWGQIRGGTPAKKISEEEYLAFFHSGFLDSEGTRWYVMGAYTFSALAPYEIRKISTCPIIYKGIYDTPTYRDDLKVCFPSGFVTETKNNRELIHLSCAENDMGIKIITIDKEALLKSLKSVIDIGKQKFHRFSKYQDLK